MQTITTIGLDLAKSVFQVHGVDAGGQVIVRRQLKRRYVLTFFQKLSPCLVGIEACGSAHHWSRELQALGHTVRLMPPAYVKPYVKRQKNDATDAEAICEAVTRANMRFVPTKTSGQQSGLLLHRARHLFIRQQTSVINAIRAHLAEFGIVAPVGRHGVEELLNVVTDPNDHSSGVSFGTRGSTAKHQAADIGVRPADQGLAPIQRDEHEARGSPRRRSGTGHRFGRCRC
jgi:transposase